MPIYENSDTTTAVITVATSATTSAAVSLIGVTILGVITPSALTGTSLTFQVSSSAAGTYVPLYDSAGTQVSVTVAASRGYYLDPAIFAGWRYVKLVSGSSEAADRTFTLFVRPV